MLQTQFVLGYPVHIASLAQYINKLASSMEQGLHQHVVTLNPEMLMRGEADPSFKSQLQSADLVLPDGAGIVWALHRKHVAVTRVPGIEFSEALLQHAQETKAPVAFIGAHPDVMASMLPRMKERFPGLNIVFSHHGYFPTPADMEQAAQSCAQLKPQYIFVALGVPAQENWISKYKSLFTHPAVFVGVGGSFDVWSGVKQRAPELFLKLNLEWLYRITSEPWRIERVYRTLPMFVVKVLLLDKPTRKTETDHA